MAIDQTRGTRAFSLDDPDGAIAAAPWFSISSRASPDQRTTLTRVRAAAPPCRSESQ